MAHTKAQKAVSGNRDSRSKRLGIKLFGGQSVRAGNVIVRQKGSKLNAGPGTLLSRDFTIIALKAGVVKFGIKRGEKYVYVS
ncbi:50S ribosomal protein L27 [Candidatus Roizmanbacteria bacterium RIFCSPHIGHO2_01_FULL_35_10]|uniref:Large ribosomal subunit protein bL27 n=1 Tax=Candidatus Roizmanbacteria bacterium RIFCSPLOWO2_01_FULL_35_13 TaxID=1802055 RepID=A0A1F7IHC5_9BACT|nr:MAG: 50S ribosomal protein L27 [Candidatus Roizmanbacteria bacterium RIFCSPHIGHO2_01_FULL_35_10]OGK42774.1 MAG: 50S ribosomal protein L27 [Candidatus Roizmanbacteria bacterium RIFCSPLOWO2_01_FULL_35_13]